MGADFIRRVAPTFHRALDRRAIELHTPNLFTSDIQSVARTASAEICEGVQVVVGEKLLVRHLDGKLIMQRDNCVVGIFQSPPPEYLNAVCAGSGIAGGEVKVIHSISGIAEIAICE